MQIPNTVRVGLGAHVFNRTVYLRVQPKPETLAERRAVLRMLQRTGEVEVFKKLRRDDSFISIFRSSKDAIELVRRAPIRYEFVVENIGVNLIGSGDITPTVAPIEAMRQGDSDSETPVAELEADEPVAEQLPETPEQQEEDGDPSAPSLGISTVKQRSFVLSAFITNQHGHYTHIRRSRLYGPWEHERHATDTFMSRALRDLVPSDHDTQPFADWITLDQLNETRIEEHDEQKRSGLATTYVETRRARRLHKQWLHKNMGNVGQTLVLADEVSKDPE
ncbi:hypothetical protein MCOR25_003087 [Pyricularia grisea]|uniref:Uncharacterized protein n=1 Tax=Pyricularia grisea TaxID=148305 RepID=A0A6P8BD15_PYRGI|nr:uncharacterized protein PgNI_03336 [Pyricularia grisea]KAI6374621.1 hypothetical protein MCOR25_003087 [Pyricularia grisea]TLD13572.1 hypothetical protein PgNI_03336 [Pyricularia grisea]